MPAPIYVDLVCVLMGGRLPIAVMACTVALVAFFSRDAAWAAWILPVGAAVLVMLGIRYRLVVDALRRWRSAPPTEREARAWEARYARVMLAYALLLGAMNASIALDGDLASHLLVVAAIFGFSAGQVARGSARPRLCGAVVLSAGLPTALGFAGRAFFETDLRAAGAYAAVSLLIVVYAFSSLETIAFNYRTLLSQLEAKRHLAGLARLDPLTELPNRLSLREKLQMAFANGGRQAGLALHLVDLDGFKSVNDSHGHPVGDKLLQEVAARLRSMLRAGDEAYRVGGDEFAIVQMDVAGRSEVEFLGRRIIKLLGKPYDIGGVSIVIGASDGTALGQDASDLEMLIERADAALYTAKKDGRGVVRKWSKGSGAGRLAVV
ncbi:MAG TPA: GGDEF domain-containing protein [Sphingomonadaceae bacterium]|nr:GGDEF domain-containing protein [Sphingomonadaceae bacterium]